MAKSESRRRAKVVSKPDDLTKARVGASVELTEEHLQSVSGGVANLKLDHKINALSTDRHK
ncbi:hypothetical protein [Labrys wisconsinensis]|uniref:Uncharacterized protein n=1 Tax=Labrys wisconsinensis TaxID=425677 RepID=A0ABU0JE91_9HYPH|nr:hypothetical protein [Labrys wisconsinensis]MDQ0471599.1 hypothetical protein [Labrys wisconsinensis]